MANLSISLEGIEQAISGLGYKENSKKYKVISTINSYYVSKNSINDVVSIDTDTLIKQIWNLENEPSKIKTKRRNFSSIKSSINKDLVKLSEKDKNPENIVITDRNIFEMSEEAKANLLNSFSDALKTGDIDINQASAILSAITDFLDSLEPDGETDKSEDLVNQIKNVLDRISNNILPEQVTEEIDKTEKIDDYGEDFEEVEIDEDEEIEVIDGLDDIEEVDDIDEDVLDEDTEEIELDEDEELEEIDEIDDDLEETELDADEELEEIDDYGEDFEEVEIDEDEELKQVDKLTEEEIKALAEFNEKKKLAEQFDEKLAEADKKYNIYVEVPKGEYTIGTKKTLKSSLELQKFDMPKVYIGKYPITNSLFEAFIEETGYVTTAEKIGSGTVFFGKFKKTNNISLVQKNAGSNVIKKACWHQPEGPESSIHGKKFHPVVQVSVEDAFAFASWIGRRLPTEMEWEAAARTDLGYKYPWGNTWKDNACNVGKNGAFGTTAVDYYTDYDNDFKISDLLGNIMEWTSGIEKPAVTLNSQQKYNIAKGGAWNSSNDISISSRALFKPNFTSNTIGFRCISEIFQ